MIIRGYRIVKSRHAEGAFTGDGARQFGGRWNLPGTAVVYLASSISLAMLEVLVHLQQRDLMHAYSVFEVAFDDTLLERVELATLPADWDASPVPADVQQIGSAWVEAGRSLALAVPSVVVSTEENYLLNPAHPQFGVIDIDGPRDLQFDRRLKA